MTTSEDQSRPQPTRSESRFAVHWNPRFRIRLVYVIYVIAVLAASLATFGPLGLFVAVAIVTTWTWIFSRVPRTQAMREAFITWAVLLLLFCMGTVGMIQPVEPARQAANRVVCWNNMMQISAAIRQYRTDKGSFPPAFVADEHGKPMHSWRVLILPQLGRLDLYEAYDFDEPWDGPNNRKLASQIPDVYVCPSDEQKLKSGNVMTSYFAVIGPNTAWPGREPMTRAQVLDGVANTLLLVESHSQHVNWMEPRDLDQETALKLLTSAEPFHDGHWSDQFFYEYHMGRNIGMADGSTPFVGVLPAELANSLLVVDDGAPDAAWIEASRGRAVSGRPNYGNWFRLGIFMLVTFFPLPWVFVHADARDSSGDL